MAQIRRRSALTIGIGVVVALGVLVLVLGTDDLRGLLEAPSAEERAEQVLAGIKAETPYVALMEERRPEVYAELRAVLVDGAADGATVMELANAGRRVLARWLGEAVARAPDALALEMLSVTTEQFRQLLETNPQMCAAMIKGQPFGDITPYVDDDLRRREQQVYQDLLTMPAESAPVTLPQAEVDAAYRQIHPDLEVRFGDDLALMGQPGVAEEDSARVCEMQIAILEAIEGLGSARAAAMARAMLAGS